jgi:hypothetical protein
MDPTGLALGMMKAALESAAGSMRARAADRRGRRAAEAASVRAYCAGAHRALDTCQFALMRVEQTKQRLLQLPLEEAAKEGEELRDRWMDVDRAIGSAITILDAVTPPEKLRAADQELRHGLTAYSSGVRALLRAKSKGEADRANREMELEGVARIGRAGRIIRGFR